MRFVVDCEQRSPEWFAARAGIITASSMADVLRSGRGKKPSEQRANYQYKLIAERITGEPVPSFENEHMRRGREDEPIIRELYAECRQAECTEAGFMVFWIDGKQETAIGYSPDALVGGSGLAELKSRLPHIQARLLATGQIPEDALLQMHTGMLVADREWCDYVSYSPGMPLFVARVYRSEEVDDRITEACRTFYAEMETMLEAILSGGET